MTEPTTELERSEEHFSELAHHPEELPMLPGEVRPHPAPRQYVMIALVLVVVTALEVAASYIPEDDVSSNLIIAVLLVMAALKFFLVVAWYMHLRTDKRMFTGMFVAGLVIASVCYVVVLLTFSVFD